MRKLFFVIGPSGSGKTTLVNYTLDKLSKKYNLLRMLNCVTRDPRPDEKYGKNAYFLSDELFRSIVARNYFVEWEEYAGFKHGCLKSAFWHFNYSFITEITPKGLEKVIQYAKENGFEDEIVIISVVADQQKIIDRLTNERHTTQEEIEARAQSDKEMSANIVPNKIVYNLTDSLIDPKEDFCNFVEYELKKVQNLDFAVEKIEIKEKVINMINVHSGYNVVKHADNTNDRFVHITVDSEKQDGTVYYVTADMWTGKIMGCSCPQAGLFPFKKCKHQKAVIEQRLLDK